MRSVFILHTAYAIICAFVLLVKPNLLYTDAVDLISFSLARTLGFSLLAMGFLTYFMLRVRGSHDVLGIGLTTLVVFHLGYLLSHIFLIATGLVPLPIAGIHLAFGAAFFIFLVRTLRV